MYPIQQVHLRCFSLWDLGWAKAHLQLQSCRRWRTSGTALCCLRRVIASFVRFTRQQVRPNGWRLERVEGRRHSALSVECRVRVAHSQGNAEVMVRQDDLCNRKEGSVLEVGEVELAADTYLIHGSAPRAAWKASSIAMPPPHMPHMAMRSHLDHAGLPL